MKNRFTVLSDRLLDRILETAPTKHRTKSGLTPSAQTVTQLQTGYRPTASEFDIDTLLRRIPDHEVQLKELVKFMIATGTRISEALQVNHSEITRTGMVLIRAKKGSNNRMISPGLATQYLLNCKKSRINPWEGWSRFFVYRQFKKYGITSQANNKSRNKVTHSLRHEVAKGIKAAGMEIEITKLALGHKNLNSTSYYHESEPKQQQNSKRN